MSASSAAFSTIHIRPLQEQLQSIAAPEPFDQTGQVDPRIYAAIILADCSIMYVSEMYYDGALVYGYRVSQNVGRWEALSTSDKNIQFFRVEIFRKPVGLRVLVSERHGIILKSPSFF